MNRTIFTVSALTWVAVIGTGNRRQQSRDIVDRCAKRAAMIERRLALPENAASPAGPNETHLSVLKAVAEGELSLDEGKEISVILENQRRIIETTDIVARLTNLEAAQGQ